MAVTTEDSDQIVKMEALPPTRLRADELGGRMRIARFEFTQGAAAGDANSLVNLVKIPAGKSVMILKNLSRITCSAFGAGRTIDIGHTGYTNTDGTAVSADADILLDGGDLETAALLALGVGTAAGPASLNDAFEIDAKSPVTIQAIILGDTIPALATLNGYIVYIQD